MEPDDEALPCRVRRAMVSAGLLFALTACGGNATSADPAPSSPAKSTQASPNSSASPAGSTQTGVTSCQSLLDSGWHAADGEQDVDVSYDPETGRTVVSFTHEQLVLNFRDDPDCAEAPDLKFFVQSALTDP